MAADTILSSGGDGVVGILVSFVGPTTTSAATEAVTAAAVGRKLRTGMKIMAA